MKTQYELKLSTGAVIAWEGSTGAAAARSYADTHPGAVIVAWREVRRGLFFGLNRIDQ